MMIVKTKIRIIEIGAVVITGFGKFLFVDMLNIKFWYVLTACLLWVVYIVYRIRKEAAILAYWGFRKDGFKNSLKWLLPVSGIALSSFVIYGRINDKLILNWHILPVMLLYPLWGVIQQFLIIGLIARNLADYENRKIPTTLIVIIASLVFSIVHFPSLLLVVATFLLSLFYGVLYLKYRNLWILGIFHGWLGGFFYFFVLGRDPWLEFVKTIQ